MQAVVGLCFFSYYKYYTERHYTCRLAAICIHLQCRYFLLMLMANAVKVGRGKWETGG